MQRCLALKTRCYGVVPLKAAYLLWHVFVDQLLLCVHWQDLEEDNGGHDHGSSHLPAVVLPLNTNDKLGVSEQNRGITTKLLKCHEGVLERLWVDQNVENIIVTYSTFKYYCTI